MAHNLFTDKQPSESLNKEKLAFNLKFKQSVTYMATMSIVRKCRFSICIVHISGVTETALELPMFIDSSSCPTRTATILGEHVSGIQTPTFNPSILKKIMPKKNYYLRTYSVLLNCIPFLYEIVEERVAVLQFLIVQIYVLNSTGEQSNK